MYVRHAHVHYKNESQRQRSTVCTCVVHLTHLTDTVHTKRNFICN